MYPNWRLDFSEYQLLEREREVPQVSKFRDTLAHNGEISVRVSFSQLTVDQIKFMPIDIHVKCDHLGKREEITRFEIK